jgi:hypothetical protein
MSINERKRIMNERFYNKMNHIFLAHTTPRHLKFVISSYIDIVTRKRSRKKVEEALMDMRNIIIENSPLEKYKLFFKLIHKYKIKYKLDTNEYFLSPKAVSEKFRESKLTKQNEKFYNEKLVEEKRIIPGKNSGIGPQTRESIERENRAKLSSNYPMVTWESMLSNDHGGDIIKSPSTAMSQARRLASPLVLPPSSKPITIPPPSVRTSPLSFRGGKNRKKSKRRRKSKRLRKSKRRRKSSFSKTKKRRK